MTLCDPEMDRGSLVETSAAERDLPEGVPPLTSFYLYLTSSCNLRCRHCWVAPAYTPNDLRPDEYLGLDLLQRAVDDAKPLGLHSAKLTGGEPTMHPQFIDLVDYLTSEGLVLTMETNGTLVDAALARHLKEQTNLSFVSVSIDGPSPEVHDPFRGVEGSFEAAVRGFRNLVDVGYRPQLIMCPHRGNIEFIEDVVTLATQLGAGSVKFNPVTRTGRGIAMYERGEALDFEEVMALVRFVRGDLQSRTSLRLFISTPLAMYTLEELLHAQGDGACHVRHILGILGSGEMALCGIGRTIPELCFGSLRSSDLREVWVGHPFLQQLRHDLDGEYPGVCGQCIHARRCLAYCVADNYRNVGRLVAPAWLCAEAYDRGIFPPSRIRGSHGR